MQIVKLSVPVPSIGPAVDVHLRTRLSEGQTTDCSACRYTTATGWPIRDGCPQCAVREPASVAWAAAYDRQAGAWVLPETPDSVAELLQAAGVVLR